MFWWFCLGKLSKEEQNDDDDDDDDDDDVEEVDEEMPVVRTQTIYTLFEC